MLTDEEAVQLVVDAHRMAQELESAAERPASPAFPQAARWLETLRRITAYAVECVRRG
ncbi:MAG: hypothetical protein ABSA54_03815 [Terriglobales bacterium]|jgi:hypothetical protein